MLFLRWLMAISMLLLACTPVPPQPRPPELIGLADFHGHQFAHLGFGGALHAHSVMPSDGCRQVPPYNTSTFRVSDLVREGLFKQSAEQANKSQCYPTWNNLSGQQMDVDSLHRAWKYGLRLQVVLAVNSEFLCIAAQLGSTSRSGPRTSTCLDPPAIDAQLQAAHDLEKEIDTTSGGPGKGWYRIVTTPEQARQVIGDGKLAVVLGVESANAYGTCQVYSRGNEPGIPNLVGSQSPEAKFGIDCAESGGAVAGPIGGLLPGFDNWPASFAEAYFEHYWDQGARAFFLIHNLPGAAGANSLSVPLLHAANNPSRLSNGGLLNRLPDIDRVLLSVRPPFSSHLCGVEFDGARCNADGLNSTGFALARMMADYGAIIDADHLSLKSEADLRGADGLGVQYPLVSSHAGFLDTSHGDQSNEDQSNGAETEDLIKWGGAFAPILHQGRAPSDIDTYPAGAPISNKCGGTSESFVQQYRYIVDKLKTAKRFNGDPAYVGVGYGSDFNGLATWPAPRFDTDSSVVSTFDPGSTLAEAFIGGSNAGHSGFCYLALGGFPAEPPHVQYPFTSPGGLSFDRSELNWSGRSEPYDISSDGVAHVGMIPDFVEELRAMGLNDEDLKPLWHGAESYIRTWEDAGKWAGNYTNEGQRGVREICRSARADLVNTEMITDVIIAKWRTALDTLRANSCKGAI
jgi:microsomal dipeptidase-like Zn-dependent dipeptidase